MKIHHYFFGLECEIDRELTNYENLERNLKEKKLDFKAINFVNQIHSNQVLVIDDAKKIHAQKNLPKADAIITNISGLAIAIITADCAPIVLKDEKAKIAAIIHAGWRGAKADIIKNAVLKMQGLGANVNEIKAFVGPMIHQESYQVSTEFYDDFLCEDKSFARFFIKDFSQNDKFLFDLVAFVEEKLRQSGVLSIENVEIDTYENYQKFASYRKNCHLGGEKSQRNISVALIS